MHDARILGPCTRIYSDSAEDQLPLLLCFSASRFPQLLCFSASLVLCLENQKKFKHAHFTCSCCTSIVDIAILHVVPRGLATARWLRGAEPPGRARQLRTLSLSVVGLLCDDDDDDDDDELVVACTANAAKHTSIGRRKQ